MNGMWAAGDKQETYPTCEERQRVISMECSELRDIADSCLSDDSIMKRNNEALKHLELCDDCLREITDQWNLRVTLHTAVMQAPASQMSDEFAVRLRARLRLASSLRFPTRLGRKI